MAPPPATRQRAVAAAAALLLGARAQQVVNRASWMPVDASTPATPTTGTILVANATHMIAFGGAVDGVGTVATPAAFNYVTTSWTPQPNFPGIALSVSNAAIAPVSPSITYAFGGTTATGVLSNVLFQLTGAGATVIPTNGTAPSPRRLAAAVYLANCYPGPASQALPSVAGPCFVVFGGTTTGNVFLNDMFVLDMRTQPYVWSSPTMAGKVPSGRHSTSAVASGDGTQATIFGGLTAAGAVNDIFTLAPGGFAKPTAGEMNNLARPFNSALGRIVPAGTTQSTTDPVWAGNR